MQWSTIKTKLSDILKTFIEAVNTALVTVLNTAPRSITANDSTAATDHWRTVEVKTSSVTVTLADAATMAAGHIVDVANQSTGNITIALATSTDTIDTVTGTTQTIYAKECRRYIVNAAATGYITAADVRSPGQITASLGADVALSNTGTYFDGPSIAQGTAGTWLVTGTVTVQDTAGVAHIDAKLWDGTTVIAAGRTKLNNATDYCTIALSGYLASPVGNLRISCKDGSSTSGKIIFNGSGNSKDSTISAIRIA